MTFVKRLNSTHSTETSANGLEERAYAPLVDEADEMDPDANASNMHTRPEIMDNPASFNRAHTTDSPSPGTEEQNCACTSFEVDQGCAKHKKMHTNDNESDWTRFLSMAQEKHDDNQRKMYMELSSGMKLQMMKDLFATLCSARIDKKVDAHVVSSFAPSDDIEVELPDYKNKWLKEALEEDAYEKAYYALACNDEGIFELPSPPNGLLEVSSSDEQGQGLCDGCYGYGLSVYHPVSENNRTWLKLILNHGVIQAPSVRPTDDEERVQQRRVRNRRFALKYFARLEEKVQADLFQEQKRNAKAAIELQNEMLLLKQARDQLAQLTGTTASTTEPFSGTIRTRSPLATTTPLTRMPQEVTLPQKRASD